MTTVKQHRAIPPVKLNSIMHGVWAGMLLQSAIRSDLFEPLASGPKTAEEVAQAKSYDTRSVHAVLDSLLGLDLDQSKNNKYDLNELSRIYLLKSSDLYLGQFMLRSDNIVKVWEGIPEMLKTGKPSVEVNKEEKAEEFFPALAAGI